MPEVDLERPRLFTNAGRPATDVCAKCGYSLRELPTLGICPECGTAYRDDKLLIYGNGRGNTHASISTAKGKRLILPIVLLAFIIGMPFVNARSPWSQGHLIFIPVWIVLIFVAIGQRRADRHPGLVQVRLNSHGCVQHNDLSGPTLLKAVWPYLFGLLTLAWIGYESQTNPAGPMMGLMQAVPLVIGLSIGLVIRRRMVSAAAGDTRWADLRDEWQRAIPMGWGEIGKAQVMPVSDGHYQLKIRARRGYRLRREPVNVEFEASADEVRQLEAQIVSCAAPFEPAVATLGSGPHPTAESAP